MSRLHFLALLFPLLLSAQEDPREWITKEYNLTRTLYFDGIPIWEPSPRGHFGTVHVPLDQGEDPFAASYDNKPVQAYENHLKILQDPVLLKTYLRRHTQVEFPEGSWINYDVEWQRLTMRNTRPQHERLHSSLIREWLLDIQIQITLRIVRFSHEEFDVLDRKYPGGIPDEVLVAYWQSGNGVTRISQSLKTINGVNAIIENVDEILYPTEMDIPDDPKNPTSDTIPYGGVETREVGAILNMTPTVSMDRNTINLVALPYHTEWKGPNPDHPDALQPITPVFNSINLTTSIMLQSGSIQVSGRSTSRDDKAQDVMFLSATLVDTEGRPLNTGVLPGTGDEESGE